MNQPTVDNDKTLSESWEVKKQAGNDKWTVKSIIKWDTGDETKNWADATTGQQYTCTDRGVSFTITAGNPAFSANDTFTFRTRRNRENEVAKEADQSEHSKSIGKTP